MNTRHSSYAMLSIIFLCFSLNNHLSDGIDTISENQSLSGDQTIISSGGNFELGFFQPGNSSNFYIGIWYKKISERTIVWVANRDTPISAKYSSGLIILNGSLVLLNEFQTIVWSTNIQHSSTTSNISVIATLGDDGNLILKDARSTSNSTQPLWQSFDYPTHTFLPGNKIGFNKLTGTNQILASWKTSEDPSPGLFSIELDPNGSQFLLRWNRSETYWTSGAWNGDKFSSMPEMRLNYIFNYSYVSNENESYFTYSLYNTSIISRFIMDISGQIKQLTWLDGNSPSVIRKIGFDNAWNLFWSQPRQQCEVYGYCGAFSACNQIVQPFCNCLPGFVPKSGNDWNLNDFSGGCARKLAANDNNKAVVIGSVIGSIAFAVSVVVMGLVILRRWKNKQEGSRASNPRNAELRLYDTERRIKDLIDSGHFEEDDKKGIDVPFFDLESILAATNNFSLANKLGQGGFGPVYKGKFPGGQEIAVKRLSSHSGQGLEEFKNEVVLIAKLQHRNLVRILGYCVKGDEKILLYEYMPNKSLDAFLFDRTACLLLNWEKRFDIILGVARGLLYLHEDSRLRIIHRDMKTSNILLDEEMNPKISDFGLARIVGGKETEANTNKVVGTYGYMSPEYALDGLFSIKSDVFSFGVVVLEIVSGKRNAGFYRAPQSLNLLGYAWRLWKEEKALDLMDHALLESCNRSEVLKCIIIGLLCVQEDPGDRPTMSTVVFMLGSEIATLPNPKQPAFVTRKSPSTTPSSSSSKQETHLNNELTDILEEGR